MQGAAGLLLLLCLAGTVQLSRNPERMAARLALVAGLGLVVALGIFIARGDFFRDSGVESSDSDPCGYARTC